MGMTSMSPSTSQTFRNGQKERYGAVPSPSAFARRDVAVHLAVGVRRARQLVVAVAIAGRIAVVLRRAKVLSTSVSPG